MDDKKVTDESANKTEDVCEHEEHKSMKKKQWWQRFLLCTCVVLCVILLSGIVALHVLRSRGENNLKAEEKYITYDGKEYKYRQDIVNILCLGIDKDVPIQYIEDYRGNIGMSDAILLVSIDVKRDEMKIIAIPRDTMAEVQTTIDGVYSAKEKLQICYQYAYGVSMQQSNQLTVDAVSHLLYDIQIQRCCAINCSALPEINDAIGGVDVEVLEDIEEWEPRLKYGETIHLDGELAFRFVNVRNKHRADGSVLRTQRQKQYALAFVDKAKSVIAENPSIPITIYQELQKEGNMCTDITLEDIAYLMPEVMGISFSDDMIQMLPGESTIGERGFAEFYMDADAVKELIINTFYEEV